MASGSALQSKLRDDFLTCPICCLQFVDPKVLKCQHSFCSRCLKGCLKAGSFRKRQIKCAVCRKSTSLTKKGISDIPNNFVIIGLMQMLKDHKKDGGNKSKSEESTSKMKGDSKNAKELEKVVKKAVKKGVAKDKNANKRKTEVEDTESDDTSQSSESVSEGSSSVEEFSPTDDISSEDSSSCTNDSDDSEDSSDDEADEEIAPPTPTLKSSLGIKKGMKICVFNEKGRPYEATVRVLERFKRKSPGQTRVYAGIELDRENSRINTTDLEDMEDTYLYNWLMDYDYPCAVVRVDQCCPSRLLSDLLPFAKK